MSRNIPPVIILGMHRSGTTLISGMLEKCGLFLGSKKDQNNEAFFFLNFNDWLLKQVNATWDNPYTLKFIPTKLKDILINSANLYISSFKRINFLGFKKSLIYKNLKEVPFPWGWKDPRNSILLDIWLNVFPNAKILHIYRNPIDVAVSLRNRSLKEESSFRWTFLKKLKAKFAFGNLHFSGSVRVRNLKEGIKLWKEYTETVLNIESTLKPDIKHVKYEDFLTEPKKILVDILEWIGLEYNSSKINEHIKAINKNRRFAFLKNEQLVKLYREEVKYNELVKKLNYSNIV